MTGAGDAAIERVAPGVLVVALRTPTLPPATHTNTCLLGTRRVTVVDPASPWAPEQRALEDVLVDHGMVVERILLTHHHHDHVGGALALQASLRAQGLDVPIVAHAETARLLDGSLRVDELLEPGELVTDELTWQVHHTPGHAPGHVVLVHAPSGLAIAGDMVAGTGTILIGPDDGDLGQYLHSLERMRGMGIQRLVPSHGAVLEHADALLGFYIAHRHQRSEQVRAALHLVGTAHPYALVPGIYPDLPQEAWPVAALQILAHLRWLRGAGVAVEEADGWRLA